MAMDSPIQLGDKVTKDFDGEMFNGEVTNIENEINEETGNETDVLLYTVTYEDGDSEDLYADECLPLLKPKPKNKAKAKAKAESKKKRSPPASAPEDDAGGPASSSSSSSGGRGGGGASEAGSSLKPASPAKKAKTEDVRFGYAADVEPVQDEAMFDRCPCNEYFNGERTALDKFPPGFVHLLQRLSDMCHTVAAFCADPKRCVRYTAKLYRQSGWKSVVWLPEDEWRANAQLSPRPECLVDTVHTDLVNPFTGENLLTGEDLNQACNSKTTHLFVNALDDENALANAISKCGPLKVVVLLESRIGPNVLDALKSKATTLFGLHLHMCTVTTGFDAMLTPDGGGDGAFADFFRAASKLRWLGIDLRRLQHGPVLGVRAWAAIPQSVRVLVYQASWTKQSSYGQSSSTSQTEIGEVRQLPTAQAGTCEFFRSHGPAITAAIQRLDKLQLSLIMKDQEGQSRVGLDGSISLGEWDPAAASAGASASATASGGDDAGGAAVKSEKAA